MYTVSMEWFEQWLAEQRIWEDLENSQGVERGKSKEVFRI
jgi:hypothetical protein